jgi:hypothetical protein
MDNRAGRDKLDARHLPSRRRRMEWGRRAMRETTVSIVSKLSWVTLSDIRAFLAMCDAQNVPETARVLLRWPEGGQQYSVEAKWTE